MFQRRDPEWSYETLQNKRRIAESLAAQIGAPRNVGEGLSAIGKALAARGLNKKADAREAELRGEFDQTWGSMFGGGQSAGGGASMPTQGATIPRVTTRTEGQAIADDAMAALMRQGLIERGLPPHVADGFVMNAQDESGLRTDINEIAPLVPGSRGGFGLMQWTGPRRVALEQEAASRGVDPSDMNLQLDFLVSELQGPEARAGEAILSTSDAGTAAQAIVNQFLRPAPEHRERRAAQYGQSGQDGGGFDMRAAAEIAGSPFASPAQRAIAQALMQRQISQMYPDPMQALEMEKAQLEIEALRNPRPDAPKTIKLTRNDGSEVMAQWDPARQDWIPIDAPEGFGVGGPGNADLTEGQSKLTLFQTLMEGTAPALESLETIYDPANLPDAAARSVPIAGAFFESEEGKIYQSATAAWAEGALRIATGAAAQDQEIQRVQKTYFAQPGDTPMVLAWKRQMRNLYATAIQRALGNTQAQASLPDPIEFAAQQGAEWAPRLGPEGSAGGAGMTRDRALEILGE